MFDAVCAKQAVIKQLNSRSTEMVENWKQSTRDSRAEILGNRKRVMDQISFETIKLTPCKPTDSESTIEAKYNLCMQEIKEKSQTQVVEAWKSKAIESRRLIFATMHNIVAEIKTEKSDLKKNLKSTKKINRQDLMEDLKTQVEKQPEWKAKITTQKCEAIRNKNLVNCDIREFNFELNSTKNQVQKFNAVLDQIRVPTEAWKIKNRTAIADPHKNLKLVVAEIAENDFSLASTKNPREELMMAIRSNEIEAWKQTKADNFSKLVQARKAVLCDISEKNFSLKKIPNRQALLTQIRAAYNIPESWTFLESWKENTRNQKSKIIIAHKNCMVSLEQLKGKFNLKPTQQSTRKEQLQACLENIRKEPVEAWKQKVQQSRISTFENKKALNSEISGFELSSLKPVKKSVQARKMEINEEIKSKFGKSIESWKQQQMNNKAVQFYNKHLMMNQLISVKKSNLKKTESIEQTKTSLMAAIRAKTNTSPVPEWQETERIERSKVQNNRNLVLSELRSVKKPVLGETKSLEQVRMQICKDIRARREPIEAWKEKEREMQTELYNNKRTVMQAIANGVNCIGNKRNQAELKDALMLEIRSKGEFVVPEWKEKRMAVRAKVLKNKVALNVAICALKN